jgi:hypothetical protein
MRSYSEGPRIPGYHGEGQMKNEINRDVAYAARIALTPTGRRRTEAQLKADLDRARRAAVREFRKERKKEAYDLAVESEGGFLGLGAEWIVVCAILAPFVSEAVKGFVSGASKKIGEAAGEKFIALFEAQLRKVHLNPGTLTPAPEITTVTLPEPKETPREAKQPKAAKQRTPKRGKK